MSEKTEQEKFNKECVKSYINIEDVVVDYMNDKVGSRQAMALISHHVNYMGCKDLVNKICNGDLK